jgi:SAM-dependent methyltransferase
MKTAFPRPETVNKLRFAADAAFAMVAAIQLDVFTALKDGPMSSEQLADAIGVRPARLRLLLYVLVVAGLLTEKDGRFSNTAEANHFLVNDAPSYMGNRHAAWTSRWTASLKTAESIRSGVPQAKVDFSNSPPDELERFLRNINASTVPAARALLANYDFSSTKTLVDVACGGAGLALTIAKTCPHLRVTAIDLPQVTRIAQQIVKEEGAAERVNVIAADVVTGPLPGSYDVAVLRALLQVLSSEDALRAVKNIYDALNPGGTIYIIGQILDDSRTSPVEAVGFNMAFINLFDAGESYTEKEHRDWLSNTGFIDIGRANLSSPDASSLMTARKPT